jgi:hypothetical protein
MLDVPCKVLKSCQPYLLPVLRSGFRQASRKISMLTNSVAQPAGPMPRAGCAPYRLSLEAGPGCVRTRDEPRPRAQRRMNPSGIVASRAFRPFLCAGRRPVRRSSGIQRSRYSQGRRKRSLVRRSRQLSQSHRGGFQISGFRSAFIGGHFSRP